MSEENNDRRDNLVTGALRRIGFLPPAEVIGGKGLLDPTLAASYKPPLESQIGQIDRGEAWWRDFAWEEYATKELPGLGMGFTVYPYVAVWEKIWGAVPTEDYQKYKQYYVQEPFIRATIDFHTQMTVSQGFELDYPLDTVVDDVKAFLERHDFMNLMKVMIKDELVFGNSYTEVVRTWYCHETGHDLEALRISYEVAPKDGKPGFWWSDRVDVVDKHNKMYPTHKLENPYGEIARFKPLDPMYMRVRRDAYGSILGYVQYYVFPLVTFLADEMIHLRYMPTSWTYESVYGVSMLRPILFHQELMKNYEQTMGAIMNVFLKPMFLVKVGGPVQPGMPNAEVTVNQFNQVKRYFQTSQPGQSLVIRATSPVDVQPIEPPIDRMQSTAFWLQWLHQMRTYALSVPKFFVDPAGLNRATAQTVERGYFTFIASNRQSLNAQLEQTLMPMIMRSIYGKIADELMAEYGVPHIIWKPVKEEGLEDKAKTYLPLYASRILTRDEVRKALGFPPMDEEQLEEEMGETMPPMAGAGAGAPGAGAPGMTREGEPTFGSPDKEMAERPPSAATFPKEREPAAEPAPEGGAAFPGLTEENTRMAEVEDNLEDMQEQIRRLKAQADGLLSDIPEGFTQAAKEIDELRKRGLMK